MLNSDSRPSPLAARVRSQSRWPDVWTNGLTKVSGDVGGMVSLPLTTLTNLQGPRKYEIEGFWGRPM